MTSLSLKRSTAHLSVLPLLWGIGHCPSQCVASLTLTHYVGPSSKGRSLASNTADEWNGPPTGQHSDAPRMHALRADMDQLRFALPGQQQELARQLAAVGTPEQYLSHT